MTDELIRVFKDSVSAYPSNEIDAIIRHAEDIGKATTHGNIGYFVIDYTRMQYLYWNDTMYNMTGFTREQIISETGFHYVVSHIDPTCASIVPRFLEYAIGHLEMLSNEPKHMNMFYDYAFNHSNGKRLHFLQQSVPLSFDKDGKLVVAIHFVYNMTSLKTDEHYRAIVRNKNGEIILLGHNDDYQQLEVIGPVSEREREVLVLLSENNDSKAIAKLLNISPHTVDVHRRSLLQKTAMKNTTALVMYARIVGLL